LQRQPRVNSFDTRFVVWENLPQRKTGIEQSVAARLTCPCPLIVFVARCALAARLTHYLSGWCGTGSQLLGRNISGMLTLEMFQIHGHLNLRTSCQFALGISPGSDRKKRRRSALSICATRLIAATRYVHRCHRAGRPGHVIASKTVDCLLARAPPHPHTNPTAFCLNIGTSSIL
jgi:hypothetical protein